MRIFVLLILFFALELALFIEWGSQLGVLVTLLEIFVSAVVGVQVIRMTGLRFLQELQANLHNQWWLQVRQQTMMRRVIAALLLIVPGFATDLLGVVLLVWSLFGPRGHTASQRSAEPGNSQSSGTVIEGEYEDTSGRRKSDDENNRIP